MLDYGYVADRARSAYSTIARIEHALIKEPDRKDLRINLAAFRKRAEQAERQLYELSEVNHIEVCNYRLIPVESTKYPLPAISRSFLSYQELFSQVHDSVSRGAQKIKGGVSKGSFEDSVLDFGYAYNGSLGVVLLAASKRSFFEGSLDSSIDALFQVIEMDDQHAVRDVAKTRGVAVVTKARAWSLSNVQGNFDADVQWTRSDGRRLGEVVNKERMSRMVDVIDKTSDVEQITIEIKGRLVGGDILSNRFHFVVPNAESFKGKIDRAFDRNTEMKLGDEYVAVMRETKQESFATGEVSLDFDLLSLKKA